MKDKGAHFYRCDFQVHTPRDGNWQGQDAVSEAQREAFASGLVQACREKGLGAIAITDHHDFVMYPYIRAAADSELDENGKSLAPEDRLVVFPGLELTLGVPCQAILVLDADIPLDRLPLVLEALAVDSVDAAEARLPSIVRLDHIQSLESLHEALDRRSWLKGKYIIFPNVTDGGHGTLMRKGMQAKYKGMPCVGGYIDGVVSKKVGTGNRRIFDGGDSAWGNRKIALIQTSDARHETFETLGQHSTWIKWATPTAEALRQACLSDESRISQVPPELPSSYLKRLSVSNSGFLGPVELQFNQQYNAVIGGRGTGKSTLLHYLRWALCDEPAAIGDDELANPRIRQQRLIENTLKPYGATVDVVFEINGIEHLIRRSTKTGEVLLKVGGGAMRAVSEQDVRTLLPIAAYSQKQLSSVSVRLDELIRFVTAPIRDELASVDRAIRDKNNAVRTSFADLQRQRQLTLAISQAQLRLRSLDEQANKLRSTLVAVSDGDRATLNVRPLFDEIEQLKGSWEAKVARADQVLERLVDLSTELVELPVKPVAQPPLDGTIASAEREVDALLQTVKVAALQLITDFRSQRTQVERTGGPLAELLAEVSTYETKYVEVRERSAAHESQLAELSKLEREARELRTRLETERRELREQGDVPTRHREHRSELADLYRKRSDLMASQCESMSEQSGGLIRASLHRGQGLTSIADRLRAVVSGSGLRSTKIDTFLDSLRSESDPLTTWQSVLDELDLLTTLTRDELVSSERFPLLARLGLSSSDTEKIRTKLTPDGWLDLALVSIADHPVFEYRVRESDYIPFSDASAGQQATALLGVLLAQPGTPLIIDQPEDDLDSQIVIEIIERIWKAKGRRQLVFTSHNANFVVNGDAELVVCCDNRAAGDQSGGRIKLEGAIDIPAVRDEITRIMEGGEKAFKLRRDKYGY